MCADLGIEIYPLVYEGKTCGSAAKPMHRWLTDEEVQRILALYHQRLAERRERRSLRED